MKKLLALLVASLVVLALLFVAAVGWIGSERSLHPAYYHYKWSLADYPDLTPTNLVIHSSTGVSLQCRLFKSARPSLIVLVSGYGDTQDQMLPIAEFLHQAGYTIATYNSRARAGSGGEYVTLGALEYKDLISVVDALVKRSDIDGQRIGALGISMGGATVLLSAANDPRIRAVVDDSGFSDAQHAIAAGFEHFIHLPAFPFAPVAVAIAQVRAGIDVNHVRPMDAAGRISPRPLLIIHEKNDSVVPVDNSMRNFAAAKEPKQLWLVDGTGHADEHTIVRSEYERRVLAFFNAALQ